MKESAPIEHGLPGYNWTLKTVSYTHLDVYKRQFQKGVETHLACNAYHPLFVNRVLILRSHLQAEAEVHLVLP